VVDRNAIMTAGRPHAGLGAQTPAASRPMVKPGQMTRPEATPSPPKERIPRADGADGRPASDSRQHGGRARAKLALLTWAGAYAVIMLVLAIGGPAMASWPLALRALVLSGLMAAAMTWAVAPVMTRLFRGWLLR
jgi:hypothetical protein